MSYHTQVYLLKDGKRELLTFTFLRIPPIRGDKFRGREPLAPTYTIREVEHHEGPPGQDSQTVIVVE